ncbi:hypothetical protein PV772_13800 [Pseudarthrobacter sp. CC12]
MEAQFSGLFLADQLQNADVSRYPFAGQCRTEQLKRRCAIGQSGMIRSS